MKIGVIGLCGFTVDFANRAATVGHQVLLSSTRENRQFKDLAATMGEHVKLVSKNEAVEADIALLFIPHEDVGLFMKDLPDMSDKILLQASNPIFSLECLRPNSKSSSEMIASLLPEAHIVKVLTIINPNVLSLLNQKPKGNEIFFTGTDREVKNKVKTFFKSLNLAGVDFEDFCLPPRTAYSMN